MKLIALDWGSSSFRAYLIDDAGQVAERVENKSGVFSHSDGNFSATLMQACGDWLKAWPQLPIIMSGMIGSRSGWIETPYLACPLRKNQLAQHLCSVKNAAELSLYVVPGISANSPSDSPDVMRGEEVQIFGALQLADQRDAVLCLPGTHSKWANVKDASIHYFSTFFSGEMFALLKKHSSIGAVMDDDSRNASVDEDSFIQGVQYSRQAGGLLHHLFSARARLLTNCWTGKSLSAYLSGIVIGHEFSEALKLYPTKNTILLVGNSQLQQRYQLAAQEYHCTLKNIDAELATVNGLCAIANEHLLKNTRILNKGTLC
ncbi:MAG: 2-dehydro-3-deoxygalactonokinase [Spongiibacteraceae bacterium]|nr:2-dehydro-3-deoxygalactonokinase [Spongiibacteraceae bacterium]